MIDPDSRPVPPSLGLGTLFLKFLRFGAVAFGGPVAQIAMLRQALVEEERWIDRARFHRLLAVLQVLPGPEAHELCVHLGMVARGRIGGVLAGLGFMLPGFGLMLLAGWVYVTWIAGAVVYAGALLGVQIAVLAIILRAVARIGRHILADWLTWAIAVAGLAATLAGVAFWLPLAAGALAYAAGRRPAVAALVLAAAAGVAIAIGPLTGGGPAQPVATGVPATLAEPVTIAALFWAGLKGGLLTFGGAYTAIPYVRADTVGRGWISDASFLDGVAVAGVLPAPLVIFVTFVGYVAGGPAGAVAATLGMFLPAFAFSLLLFERMEAVIDMPALHRALEGVAAAVVGIIAATFVQLGTAAVARVPDMAVALPLFLAASAVAWRIAGSWVTPAIVAGGGVAGWLLL